MATRFAYGESGRITAPSHIADVAFAMQFTFYKMVKWIEIAVCPELAGEVANRQAARAVDRKETLP